MTDHNAASPGRPAAAPPSGESSALRQQGNEAFKHRDYAAAVKLYGRALGAAGEEAEDRAAILSNRSMTCYKLGWFAQSAADAEASLALDPCNHKARYRAALAHLMLGEPQAAQPHVASLLSQHHQQLREQGQQGHLQQQQEEEEGEGEAPGQGAGCVAAAAAAEPQPPQPLPAYLCILSDAAAAMGRHAACKAALQEPAPGSSPAAPEAQRVQQLLQVLGDDLDGEADADITAVLGELRPLLQASPEARAAFELRSGYPLVLCYFSEAYCDQAAAALQAASGWQPALGGSTAGEGGAEGPAGLVEGRTGAVMWPAFVWQRLASTALCGSGSGGSGPLAAAAMQLLSWAAGDPWARTQVLVHPPPAAAGGEGAAAPGAGSAASILQAVVGALQQLPESWLSPAVAAAAVELLGRYGEDASSAEALAQLRLRPLATLLHALHETEALVAASRVLAPPNGETSATAGASGSGAGVSTKSAGSQLAAEQEALEELRERQKGVYDARVVALRRAVLRALCALCGRAEMVAAEAPQRGGKGKGRSSSQTEGFAADLLRLVRGLHEQSPKRTGAVLGPDGRPKTFSKKPFAADFKDNPAGDFLAGLDLEGATADRPQDVFDRAWGPPPASASAPALASGGAGQRGSHQLQPTLLELALTALLRLACAGGAAAAAQLCRLDAVGLAEALWAYTTPSVVELAQRLCAALAERHPATFSELLVDGSVMGLAGVLQFTALPELAAPGADPMPPHPQQPGLAENAAATSGSSAAPAPAAGQQAGGGGGGGAAEAALQLLLKATDKLGALVDGCSGDEFAHLTQQPGGALLRAFQLAHGHLAGPLAQACGQAMGGQQHQKAGSRAASTDGGSAFCSEVGAAPVAEAAPVPAKLQAAATRFVRLCCDKAQRQQGLPRWQCPRGGAWDRIGRAALQAVLPARQGSGGGGGAAAAAASGTSGAAGAKDGAEKGLGEGEAAQPDAGEEGEGLSKLKKGFLAGGGAQRAQRAAQRAAHAAGSDSASSGLGPLGAGAQRPQVMIEDITEQEAAKQAQQAQQGAAAVSEAQARAAWEAQQAQQAWLAHQRAEQEAEAAAAAGEESDEEELRDVYDSTPSLEVRQARNAWMAVPLNEKVRWDQTSTDINAWVVMPPGTRARDVRVTILPDRLTVGLGWYGRVADGPLHRRVKASEAQWCMEDNEVHVVLPKDDRSYWKTLYEGGEEKGYYDLLKEAVNADEPAVSYDDMDERSKELLERMLDRQAMISEGLVDLDGFDDFRVVVGENSLVQR